MAKDTNLSDSGGGHEKSTSSIISPSRHNTSTKLSSELEESILVAYRSIGIGSFGVVMRYVGMPLEKIALYMNSSQVTGKNQFAQSIRLTFQGGALAPYRVVGEITFVHIHIC